MIGRIEIHNYKLFDKFSLQLNKGINLICGPNGSGKSALLEAVYALKKFLAMPDFSDQVAWPLDEAFPFNTFCRWLIQEKGYGEMSFKIEIDDKESFEYAITVRYNFLDKKSRVQTESLTHHPFTSEKQELLTCAEGSIKMCTDDRKQLSFKSGLGNSGLVAGSGNNSVIRRFGERIAHIYPLHLVPFSMKQNFEKPAETLDQFGTNFPAWRFHCSNTQSERQPIVQERCKSFIPGLVGINNVKKGDGYGLAVRVSYKGKNYDMDFNELSDGQKSLLALHAILENIPDRSTVLIDEPENFLAPSELQPWLNAMNDAWEERDIQFVMVSHNPDTLNWHSKGAVIFDINGEPPRVSARRHAEEGGQPLTDKLREMEWGYR